MSSGPCPSSRHHSANLQRSFAASGPRCEPDAGVRCAIGRVHAHSCTSSLLHTCTHVCMHLASGVERRACVCVCVCAKEAAGVVLVRAHRHMQDAQRSSSPQLQKLSALSRKRNSSKRRRRKKGQPQKIVRKLSGMLGTRGSTTGNIMQHRRLLQRADLGAERRYGFVSKTQLTGKPLFFLCVCVCVRACVRADCKRSKKACWDLSIQHPHHLFSAACIRTC